MKYAGMSNCADRLEILGRSGAAPSLLTRTGTLLREDRERRGSHSPCVGPAVGSIPGEQVPRFRAGPQKA